MILKSKKVFNSFKTKIMKKSPDSQKFIFKNEYFRDLFNFKFRPLAAIKGIKLFKTN